MQAFFILFTAGVLFYLMGLNLHQPVTLGHAFAFLVFFILWLDQFGIPKSLLR